jgi:hypothetical protein
MSDGRVDLEQLGVLIGRASTQRKLDRVFVIVGAKAPPRVPQDMIETRRLPILAHHIVP